MSTTSVCVLGTPGFIREPERFGDREILEILGENSGNLMFQFAATNLVQAQINVSPSERSYSDHSAIAASVALVFPAANHLRLGADWSGLNNYLEGVNKPLIVLGLGAQSPKIGGEGETISALKADAGVRRMVDIFRERARLITVRGSYSQQVCAALGLEAVEVLGCPSALINPLPDLGRRLAVKLRDLSDGFADARIGVTAAAPFEILDDVPRAALERKLIAMMAASSGLYIQQSGGVTAMRVAKGVLAGANESELSTIYNLLGGDMPVPHFWNMMGQTGRFYTSAMDWIREMHSVRAVFGSRLHGSMAAIAAGTPGVIIAHDSRTAELSSLMRLPALSHEAAMGASSVAELAQHVEFDGDAFDAWRNRTACRMRNLLSAAGVDSAVPLAHAVDRIAREGAAPLTRNSDQTCEAWRNSALWESRYLVTRAAT